MIQSTTLESFHSLLTENQDKIKENGAFVPVIIEHLADMETPVSVYNAVYSNEKISNSFILESAEGIGQNALYSFIGFNPFLLFKIEDDQYQIEIKSPEFKDRVNSTAGTEKPLDALKNILASFSVVHPENLPRLISGAVGYLGYDTIRLLEEIPFKVTRDQQIPQGLLGFFNSFIIFDNIRKTIMYVHAPLIDSKSDADAVFKKAVQYLESVKDLVEQNKAASFIPNKQSVEWKSNMEKSGYENIVNKAKEYIAAGDIFQVVLSQRFSTKYEGDPFNIYRVLRIVNPSPYLYFINLDELDIIGSSPELLVRIENNIVSTRPIAGTRPRGHSSTEDNELEQELLQDKKELAEHLMLVDLGRNDLGKVCSFGSVHVSRMMKVEKYSHVMHIVSDVTGNLNKSYSPVDALYATFPAGTLSGAPKIRAMEIIDELEPTERAVYGGAIGYFDFSGNMDWCIAIRTVVLKDSVLTIQSGAGIVADSVPENEFQETMNKAQALKTAVEWAGATNQTK
ncbi:MAG: anthranilate synthase component I [Calditrichaeota bacterium]|nr:anthranilate synthase component I [Calditrichota bacterium]